MIHSVVIWGGDVNLGRRQHYRTAELGVARVVGRLPALREAHLRIANLECVVATTGEQGLKGDRNSPYYFRARPEMLRVLTAAGVDVVTTANNHSGDYGPQALLEQQHWLNAAGVGHAGSGVNRQAAFAPVIRRAGDLNVAVLALDTTARSFAATDGTPGTAWLPPNDLSSWGASLSPQIASARKSAQVVLVAIHWGRNNATAPEPNTIAAGHVLIEAGADAVLGASAHRLQGVEIYRNRPIIYDAGNLLFDAVRLNFRDAGLFRLDLSARGVEQVTMIPVGVGFGFTVQRRGRGAFRCGERFAEQCAAMGTRVRLTADGRTAIPLQPPWRRVATPLPATATGGGFRAMDGIRHGMPADTGVVETVPADRSIEPVRFGPLVLVGLRVRPLHLRRRRPLWVETFWRAEQPVDEDIRLDIRAVPIHPTTMPAWGKSMDHDPCDWMMPTRRWQPGRIYRDYYGLRAPRPEKLANVDLQLEIGIIAKKFAPAAVRLGPIITMNLPHAIDAHGDSPAPTIYATSFPGVMLNGRPEQTWTAEQLAAVTGGRWLVRPPKGWFVKSIAHQRSLLRLLPPPFCFVAHTSDQRLRHAQSTTPKPWYDRHSDLPRLSHRLAGAMVSRSVDGLPPDLPILRVADPIRALIELGLAARQRFAGEVVAITGTAGKSTTVAMLHQIMGGQPKALASLKNYNTRVDVPSLLANLRAEHEAAIVEIAQSALWMKRGPITRLIKPTISVITEIGISQSDRMCRSVQDTARWKARIFDGLTGSAVAILGDYLECFEYIHQKAVQHARRVLIFGHSASADMRIVSVRSDGQGSWVDLRTPVGQYRFRVPVPSVGMIHNVVAALAVVYAMGRDLSNAIGVLQRYVPAEGCLQLRPMVLQGHKVAVIDDSWNATDVSMRNALAYFADCQPERGGRKIAVLGRMVHLGDLAQPLHAGLAAPLLATGVDRVITHGDEMRYLRTQLPERKLGPHFEDAPDLARCLIGLARDGDLILIKGSRRDSDFGDIVGHLKTPPTSDQGPNRSGSVPQQALIKDCMARDPNDFRSSPWHKKQKSLTTALLLDAARRRGLSVLWRFAGYFELGATHEPPSGALVFRQNSPNHSYAATAITHDRYRLKKLLALHAIPVADGAVFTSYKNARRHFDRCRGPVWVKPLKSSRGRALTPGVTTSTDFAAAWRKARRFSPKVMVEHHLEGDNLRILVLGGRAVAAFLCLPAAVTGNGRDRLETLVAALKHQRRTNPWLRQWWPNHFDTVPPDGYTFTDRPDADEQVPLSLVGSPFQCATTVEVTQQIDGSLARLAETVVGLLHGLHFACVSMMVPAHAVTHPDASRHAVVLDVKSKPALADVVFPVFGAPRPDLPHRLLEFAVSRFMTPAPAGPPTMRPANPMIENGAPEHFSTINSVLERQIRHQAAQARNLRVESPSSRIMRLVGDDQALLFYKGVSHHTRMVARRATNGDKDWMKHRLRAAGIRTPVWQTFADDQRTEAWRFVQRRNVPMVLKPITGSWGRGITTMIVTRAQFDAGWQAAAATGAGFIIAEELSAGNTYRFLVIGMTVVAVARIAAAAVTGDGMHALAQLVALQNDRRERNPGTSGCPIVIPSREEGNARLQQWNPEYVPARGQYLPLHTIANIAAGGESRDVTETIHPGFAAIAVAARQAVFDPAHAGIDMIAGDIAAAPATQSWTVLEVNTNPDLSIHHFPSHGMPRNAAEALLEGLCQKCA